MEKFRCGTDLHGDVGDNACSVEHPAGPTDLSHIPGHGQLLIAEDSCTALGNSPPTCGHVNNAVWSVSLDPSTEYTRLLTAAKSSSVSSPYFHSNLKGQSYLTATLNELYDDFGQLSNAQEPSAAFGYIGPISKSVISTWCYLLGFNASVCRALLVWKNRSLCVIIIAKKVISALRPKTANAP